MKLRNKKTGEIVDLLEIVKLDDISNEYYLRLSDNEGRTFKVGFNSLAELNEEWEDYEEPKEYWFIDTYEGTVVEKTVKYFETTDKERKEIGNYFGTREEAELTVRKLKAWKRLEDKGFSIYSWDYEFDMVDKPAQTIILRASAVDSSNTDLDLLFSQEGN